MTVPDGHNPNPSVNPHPKETPNTMLKRDQLTGELNKAAEAIATARSTNDTEAIAAAVVHFDALERELKALDRTAPQVTAVEVQTPEVKSFGRSAADKLVGAPMGTTISLERTLLADPFGQVVGAQDATLPEQLTRLARKPDAPIRFIDTLPTVQANSDTIVYVRETGFDNQAAARLAGAPASESIISVERVSEPVANIAHILRAAEETVADNPALGALIDDRGVYGVRDIANRQLLANANTPNGMKSAIAAASEIEYTGTLTDGILSAKVELEHLGFNANYVALSPSKYEEIMAAKADDGHYLYGGPTGAGMTTMWGGLRVVTDSALPAGVDALVYDSNYARIHVRDNASVALDRDIVSNVVTVRVQTRGQLAIERPEGFIKLIAAGAGS